MSFFQKTVVNKYLKAQDKEALSNQWQKCQQHFHDEQTQENIRTSKEEQYQEGFIEDLFVNVLGYTKNPSPNYNIITEQKNVSNSKKADGAIILHEKITAVIELKDTKTTDLNKIETQAFGYKNNHPDCIYIITSNFEKIRLYINNATEYQEFNLFQLAQEEFELLYLCLAYENIKSHIAKKIKQESLSQEEEITQKLYKDYSIFKQELFNNLTQLNPSLGKLKLFKKSQKLLDRFLFLFFAEDRALLPPNSVRKILEDWKKIKSLDVDIPLYTRFKQYFGYLNAGFKNEEYSIFAYNGGLFKTDDFLDNLKIDDQILYQHTQKLANYDFASEVDVNILGHIFENSLNEIDEIKSKLAGEEIDKTKTKRKKDGVFYTPRYITKYIVENTVGKLCQEKKQELQLEEEDYTQEKKLQKKTVKLLDEKLTNYRKWLLQLTVLDPACGSGAFLNEALNFLIKEHSYIDELHFKLHGDSLKLPNIKNTILENNLFGVDINEESVEIAKLSLWLRTAEKNRKLNDLSNNIKCGNSLIEDPNIAGEKAFNWQQKFPQVFAKSGFDVVIGNPPYGAKLNPEIQSYLNKKYIQGASETVIAFIKLSYDNLLKSKGEFGFIIPKSFSFSSNYSSIRSYIKNSIVEIVDCKKVWKEVKLEQIILTFTKENSYENYYCSKLINQQINKIGLIDKKTFDEFGFYLNDISNKELNLAKKIKISNLFIKDIANNSRGGIFQKFITDEGDTLVLGGAEIQRNGIVGIKGKINKELIEKDRKNFIQDNSILVQRIVAHIENPVEHIKITACYPQNKKYAIVDTINQITFNDDYSAKVFWLIFNSKLINWYSYRFIFAKAIRTMQFDNPVTNRIPIPKSLKENQQSFIEKADLMLELNQQLQETSQKFQRTLQRKFEGLELSKKLEKWFELSFADFIKELIKKKIKLSLSDEAQWEDYFLAEQQKAQQLKNKINTTDEEINQMTYKLYDLTNEEINIIQESTK